MLEPRDVVPMFFAKVKFKWYNPFTWMDGLFPLFALLLVGACTMIAGLAYGVACLLRAMGLISF